MTGSSVETVVTRQFRRANMTNDDYDKQVYQSGDRTNDSVSAVATQTWNRLTDTRIDGAYATDRQ